MVSEVWCSREWQMKRFQNRQQAQCFLCTFEYINAIFASTAISSQQLAIGVVHLANDSLTTRGFTLGR
jgi:hypothetical protein